MLKSKKFLSALLAVSLTFSLAACGGGAASSAAPQEAESTASEAASAPSEDASAPAADDGEKPYVAVISKGFQHQFWQVVKKGAEQAAEDLNVEITFDGPPSESDIPVQVDMLKAALDKDPAAVALAALDTESVTEQLQACLEKGIPVVGFDSGVPNAPEGSIYATASTDNAAAAALAAENLMKHEGFKTALAAATTDAPIYVGVLSQDATSESVVSRTSGFIDKLVADVGADDVEVKGHDKYKKDAANGAKVIIQVNVPATTSAADMKSGAESMLISGNFAAMYGSNENAAGGMLAASNDGSDFNPDGGKYKDIVAIGFDAGKTQREAVEKGYFYGSITQDPFQIGYKAVALAVDAIDGKAPESQIIDTGAKWYNSENLNDADITELVYE